MTLDAVSALAHAVEDNWCDAWASLELVTEEPRTIVSRADHYLSISTPGIEEALLNIILRYRSARPVTPHHVLTALRPFQRYGLRPQWWLLLGAEPLGLRDALFAVGMQCWGSSPAMALDLRGWHPAPEAIDRELELMRVTRQPEALDALAIMTDVFCAPWEPMRRWTLANPVARNYAARWRGEVVSALTLIPSQGMVGVYNVATDYFARRHGIAGALLRFALHEAHADGLRLATLTSTAQARHVYERLGFRVCGQIEQWSPGPGTSRFAGNGTLMDDWE